MTRDEQFVYDAWVRSANTVLDATGAFAAAQSATVIVQVESELKL
jgi:hypothetical protein